MSNRNINFIGWLLVISMIFDAWLFVNSQTKPALFVLIFSICILFLIFIFFQAKIEESRRTSAGIMHLFEKSEENRTNAEDLKNKILLMVDDLPEGILIINKDDKISVINSRAERFLGVHRKQVLNKPILDLGNLSNVRKIVFPMLINFKASHKSEIEVRKNFILEITIEPLFLSKNNIAKLIILHDITKIKYAQQEKNEFISVAAHQLKSPLSATRLSLKMLLEGDFGKISKEQRAILEKTYKKNESLIYLVEDLLKEAKTEMPDQFDNRALISFENLVPPIIDFYKDEMKIKKIDFKFNKPNKKLPEILADQEKIEMVIQNLLDNAVKYTPPKGRIEVSIIPKKDELEFMIKDSGVGIPEDQKEKIFTRFSRAANAIESKEGGTGLGLAIAKEIIEKHHGKIWFESRENEGSTFFFSLPFTKR
jgi:two-component system, OmpR family, sensor histidine kinase VicK